eukprot:CAMPEP_0118934608 /NCGR_PEP_ID=MMETSP1169-20130426/13914_1 /TAXON_ID=36882 /ORGANISM="Pyramimonas obovata, Strain CCMP722" /LENGTH=278 /DNA_ID=CAMNT_0006877529 /DNA_START=84 /DNA_END=920 /DNA_ORIENTATION=+
MRITAAVSLAPQSVHAAHVPLLGSIRFKKVSQTSICNRGVPTVTYGRRAGASKDVSSARHRGSALKATPKDLQAQQIEEAIDAAQNAIPVPESANPEDLKAFYDILEAKSWEEAQQAVADLQAKGGLNEGVVEAAVMALDKARDQPAPPGRDKDQMIATLESVCELLITALQGQMSTPTMRLVDELIIIKPAENGDMVKQRLQMEFASEEGVNKEDFLASMQSFFMQMDQQDREFEAQVEAVWAEISEEERAQVNQVKEIRRDARSQMDALLKIALDA